MPPRFFSRRSALFRGRRRLSAGSFFGGSAFLSFGVIFLISLFLLGEAVRFFPAHHRELQWARRSGQEYVDFIIREAEWSQRLVSLTNQAYFRELDARFARERGLVEGFEVFAEMIEDGAEAEIDSLALARSRGDRRAVKRAERAYRNKVGEIVAAARRERVDSFGRLSGEDETWKRLVEAVRSYDLESGEIPEWVSEAEREMTAGMASFAEARKVIMASRVPLRNLRDRLVPLASTIREESENQDDFSFEQRLEPILQAHDEHVRAVQFLQADMARGIDLLPKALISSSAADLVARIRAREDRLQERLTASLVEAGEWDWRTEVGWAASVTGFFFGTEWKAGSSWRQVFGLVPLLTGSLLVSLIAMVVAVPLAVGAAIYVNQLASRREQTLVKPAIEMIQAIPTVVLGFFGIMILGDLLVSLSHRPWFSWLPGFPIDERLNLLNAGLLLALMAVPTIFTLCEDALNNVPRSFSEASLALGASKIRTVGQVVVPAAISGIFAAVLLGFGRVIGETMVVLLVAGNRVAIPDWSEGLGVITQPGHTMTGVIAQEMGFVEEGTLHYRALFLLGLVLFLISLTVNLAAQRFVKRLVQNV